MSSQDDQDDHDLDSACRTIYESDKAALLAIQGATDSILKVIDKMDVESRPTRQVSAFIKVPKQLVSFICLFLMYLFSCRAHEVSRKNVKDLFKLLPV